MAFDAEGLKNYIKVVGISDDSLLTDLVSYIDSEVEHELNRKFAADDVVDELICGRGTPILLTKYFPVTSVDKIEVYDGLNSSNVEVWTELAVGTDYSRILIERNGAQIYLEGYSFPKGTQNIRVSYSYGYATPPVEIDHAKYDLATIYYQAIRAGKFLGKLSTSGSAANLTETLDIDARKRIYNRIYKYRKCNV